MIRYIRRHAQPPLLEYADSLMQKLPFVRALAIWVILSAGCSTVPMNERRWIDVRTAHFEILSDIGEKETLALAERLETFRAIVQLITHVHIVDPAIPVRLYVFSNSEDYALFGPPKRSLKTMPSVGSRAGIKMSVAHGGRA